ncbi:hypothetical protein NATSA_01310 [Natronogracilivirgula saccharolytica]|uniref:Uncharacterized protein n=1 Tax=Natronogracilivirga saccharolytica TaxID=2812953 RepID=A0A8J7RQS4_9BACT|nr:hypothetical protein [Natronogracilivirga saccharolytica]
MTFTRLHRQRCHELKKREQGNTTNLHPKHNNFGKKMVVIPLLLLSVFSIAAVSGAFSSASAGHALQEGSRALQYRSGMVHRFIDQFSGRIRYRPLLPVFEF